LKQDGTASVSPVINVRVAPPCASLTQSNYLASLTAQNFSTDGTISLSDFYTGTSACIITGTCENLTMHDATNHIAYSSHSTFELDDANKVVKITKTGFSTVIPGGRFKAKVRCNGIDSGYMEV